MKRKAEAADIFEKKGKTAVQGGSTEWLEKLLAKKELEELQESKLEGEALLQAYQKVFEGISSRLLNETVWMINDHPHRFAEIEFYYKDGARHDDPFVHGDAMQRKFGKWYFHRQNNSTYKSGTYKGLDISFGGLTPPGKSEKAYGGILIRAVEPLTQEAMGEGKGKKKKKAAEIVEGSCRCVDHLLSLCKADSIPNLISTHYKGLEKDPPIIAFDALGDVKIQGKNILQLVPKTNLPDSVQSRLKARSLHTSARVGLTLKRVRPGVDSYIMRPYRFLLYPDCVTKGKPNMILGLYALGKTSKY